MGSDSGQEVEGPVHRVWVDSFAMAATQVTVAEYARFLDATGRKPPPVWDDVNFSHPQQPVTAVSWFDAVAYCSWLSTVSGSHYRLPTEAEWERAARGGLENKKFTWGDEQLSDGKEMANYWQGEFPWQNKALDGFEGTSPVGIFPPNNYGLFDMAGNVWEWTSDWYVHGHADEIVKSCCGPAFNPRIASPEKSYDPRQPKFHIPRKVVKGGSHLCAPNYCLRYRPAARQPQMLDTAMSHIGFRCIVRAEETSREESSDSLETVLLSGKR
jgi:formylglycine-generating enzyme required for sulfatase activity